MNPKLTLNQDNRKKVKCEMRYYNRLQAFLLLDLRLSLTEVAEFLRHTLRTLYTAPRKANNAHVPIKNIDPYLYYTDESVLMRIIGRNRANP